MPAASERSLVVPLRRGRRSDASVSRMQALGFDPMEELISYYRRDATPHDVKIHIAETLMQYMYPKMAQVDVSVDDQHGPAAEDGSADAMRQILDDPELTAAAQMISIKFQQVTRTVEVTKGGKRFDASEVIDAPVEEAEDEDS